MTERNTILLDKAEKILMGNVYEYDKFPWGEFRMISPGMGNYPGIWNWDSAFHAIGMRYIDGKLAEEQILGFLQFQQSNGILPDVIYEDGRIISTFSKPPVMAWAAAEVYKKTGNKKFLDRVFPYIEKNENFWTTQRMIEGMFHYDADKNCNNDEYLTRVKYETGWDNSPRWDGFPQNYWPIDLNCFMIMTYDAMIFMSNELGDKTNIREKKDNLAKLINKRLWNPEIGAYTDFNFVENKHSDVLTPSSFMPLFAGIADVEKANAMNEIAKKHFLPGMPTVAYDHPAYSTDYWRGPCWLNVAYFAAKGLKNYGFTDTAEEIKETILNWVYNDGEFVHENYNAKTGEGLSCDHFSWSSVFLREFILNF